MASSSTSTRGWARNARASARSWRSPDDSDTPRSCTGVSSPSGSRSIEVGEADAVAPPPSTSSSVASGRAKAMLSRMRAGEQERLLRDDAELAAQRVDGDVAQVVAVDQHPTLGRVVEARDELGDGRLARAGRPDERRSSRRRAMCEVDVAQHRHRPGRTRTTRRRARSSPSIGGSGSASSASSTRRVRREQLVELGDRGLALLVQVVLLHELLDRREERVQVEDERGRARRPRACRRAPCCRR